MRWKKIGKIFCPQQINDGNNREWMKEFAQCPSTIIFENFIRIYFSCRPLKDENGYYKSYTTFIDVDKKDLTKILNISKNPILPLGELGTFDEFAIYPTSLIRNDNQILLYYAGWTRTKSVPFNTSIGLAISDDDGISFKRKGIGPIFSYGLDEPFVISGPKIRKFNNLWYLYYIAGIKWIPNNGKPEIVYKIRMAASLDGINWNRLNKNIISDVLENTECQAGPDVFYYKNKYYMYFSYRYALYFRNNKERGYRIGCACSSDLFNWTRCDDNVGITYSKNGWDSNMLHYPHIFKVDKKYYMLYNGNGFGKYGFGLAILESDR